MNEVITGPLLKRATASEPVIVGHEDEEVVELKSGVPVKEDMAVYTQKPRGVRTSAVSEKDDGEAVQ